MTYTEQAIKIAIENSYEPFKSFKMSEATNTFIRSKSLAVHIKGSTAGKNYYEIFFDPLFWQALGRGLGWEEDVNFTKYGAMSGWRYAWHRFIDHLIEGKDIESFFEQLINNPITL